MSNPGTPAGIVFNNTSAFVINGLPTQFIFADRNATIRAYSSSFGTSTVTTAFGTGSFTGLAIAAGPSLVVANFGGGTVAGFDSSFHAMSLGSKFVNPTLPAGDAPYNVQNLGGTIFIAYAQRSATGTVVVGKGRGIVAAFDSQGNFLRVVAKNGAALNAPWGMALAPASFGLFAGDLLVANSGNGQIHAYQLTAERTSTSACSTSRTARRSRCRRSTASRSATAARQGRPGRLYFTAGPGKGAHGQLGYISPA